jgi:16S rRNA processing protein RimM
VADRGGAEALRGQLVEVDRDAMPPLEAGEYYHADLIGLTCFSPAGETVGSVIGVENFGAGDLLEVEKVDGKRALIPFRDGIADLVDARIVLDPAFLA